jgi:hypothetical protein
MMRMFVSGRGGTLLRMYGGLGHGPGSGFGHGSQQRSIEELVKNSQGLDKDPQLPRRGCGCAALPLVALAIATPLLGRSA